MPSPQPAAVGRQTELEAIAGFLTREPAGHPSTLILEGEAGIGKTTLWRAGLVLAAERPYRVLIARPTPAESEMPFAALNDLLGEALPEVRQSLPGPQLRALEVALLLAEAEALPTSPHGVAAAVLSTLRELARVAPVLVAIDDTQWLDPASGAALEFARRRVDADGRVLFLLSERREGEGSAPLGGDGRERLRIGPLSLGALHRVLRAELGHPLPRPLLTRIRVAFGGNPFFAIELAKVATERRGRALELPLPGSLSDALRERLDALPKQTRDALLIVAVASAPGLDLLEQALGKGAQELLRPAFEAGMLVTDSDRVRFSHPLIGAAVYGEAWPERRRACHLQLADLAEDDDERTRHLALADQGPNTELASALEAAAHRARMRGAPEAAALLSEQAWAATPPDESDTVWRRAVLAAEYNLQSGDLERFQELAHQLLTTARSGDERSFACMMLSLAEPDNSDVIPWLDRALAEAESVEQRQSVESDYVTVATVGGDLAEGARHARESLRLADEIGDPAVLADALSAVARLEQLLGLGLQRDLLDRIDSLHELRQTDRLDETVALVRTTITFSGMLATADEFAEAGRRSSALHDNLARQGLVQPLPEVLRFRAELACLAGDWGLAAELAEAGDELAEQTGRLGTRQDLLYPRAFVAAHVGDQETARALALEGFVAAEASDNHRNLLRHLSVLGFLDLSLGDLVSAAASLERAAAIASAACYVEPNWLRFHGDLVETLIGLRRLGDADTAVAWLEERGAVTAYPWTHATAARGRGQLLMVRDELDAAIDALGEARMIGEQLGNPFELARTNLELGRAYRRARRRVLAGSSLTEAFASFEHLGATLWAKTAALELTRVSGRRSADPSGLTEGEQRIADCVAEGHSNKEVAATLHLAVKTVEVTLTRVYRKLGVRSRSELVRRFADGSAHADEPAHAMPESTQPKQ